MKDFAFQKEEGADSGKYIIYLFIRTSLQSIVYLTIFWAWLMESQTDGPTDRPVDGLKYLRVNEAPKLWAAHVLYFIGVETCNTNIQIIIEKNRYSFFISILNFSYHLLHARDSTPCRVGRSVGR